MATTPQDHKKKTETKPEAHPDQPFQFEHNGETFQLAASDDVLDAGFARRNRNLTQEQQFWALIEALADDAALAAIDEMKRPEFQDFQRAMYAHMGVELGE